MKISKCRICGSDNLALVYRNQKYKIFKCLSCGFGVLIPYPKIKKAHSIYQENYFSDKKESYYFSDAKRKYSKAKQYFRKGGRVLDYGCGLGDFIGECKRRDKSLGLFGFDISKYVSAYTSKNYKVEVKTGIFSKNLYKQSFFDSIVSFDVIEHVPDFEDLLAKFNFWLKKGGYLLLTTPNIENWDAEILGRRWYGYSKIPEHINYFSKKSLRTLLERNGFEVHEIKTWGFVRSLDFYLSKVFWGFSLSKIGLGKIGNVNFFLPMVDVFVVAKKIRNKNA